MHPDRIWCEGCPGARSQPERCTTANSWISVARHVRLRLRSDHVGLSPARKPGSVDATPGGERPFHKGGLLNITVQEPARSAATEAMCLRVDRWDWFVAATPDNAASAPECGTHINALESRGPPRLTVLQERYVVTTPGHTALALSSRVPTSHGFSAQSFRLGTHLRDQLPLVGRAAAPANMTFIRPGMSARGFVAATLLPSNHCLCLASARPKIGRQVRGFHSSALRPALGF